MNTRQSIVIFLCLLTLVSCQQKQMAVVEVSNSWDITHENSPVGLPWSDIIANMPAAKPDNIVLVNAQTGEEVAHQVCYHGEPVPAGLFFQVTLKPKESIKIFIKEGKPKQEVVYKTFGRFVPERKDDYAWENDRIAFRMFGPALAPENPSNGVDLWLKRTENLIVDKFYFDDLNNNKSYHVDHGEGLDCYRVGPALGAGGISPFVDDVLWVGKHFTSHETLDNGPLLTSFRLKYDNNLRVGDKFFSKEITIYIEAGSQFNTAVVKFDGDFSEIEVAAGIFLHDDPGNMRYSVEDGYTAFGEIATSDAGVPAGRNYIATVFPPWTTMSRVLIQQNHLLAIAPYKKGDELMYFFGGGWSKWGFETDEKWFDHVAAFAQRLRMPLSVAISGGLD